MADKAAHDKIRSNFKDLLLKNHCKVSNAQRDIEQAELNIRFLHRKQAAYYLLSMLSLWIKWQKQYQNLEAVNSYTLRMMGYGKKEKATEKENH